MARGLFPRAGGNHDLENDDAARAARHPFGWLTEPIFDATQRAPSRLAALMDDRDAARLMLGAKRLTRRQVAELARLPADLRHPAVLARPKRSGDAERLVFAIGLVERVRTDLTRTAILRTLSQTPEHVEIEAWTRRHFQNAAFPPPPWPGTPALRPLTSWDEVRKVAQAFRNCLRGRVSSVLAGSSYLYVLRHDGRDCAVIELVRVANDHWVVEEVKGPNNDALSARTETVLAEHLAGLPRLPRKTWLYDLVDPDG